MIATNAYVIPRHGLRGLVAALALCIAILAPMASAPAASAAPAWSTEVIQAPTHLPPGGRGTVWITPFNVGSDPSTAASTVSFTLPTGVTIGTPEPFVGWTCTGSPVVTCTNAFFGATAVKPGTYVGSALGGAQGVFLTLDLAPGTPEGTIPFDITLSGGGAPTVTESHQIVIGSEQLGFGPTPGSFEAGAFDQAGNDYTQAGGHPYDASTSFEWNTHFTELGPEDAARRAITAEGTPRDVVADLPPGFMGDPTAAPKCSGLQAVLTYSCPPSTQVGVASISQPAGLAGRARMFAVYNIEPPKNAPAQLGFNTPVGVVALAPTVRSDGDYGLSATVHNITQIDTLFASRVTLWGVPADPSHDAQRCTSPNFLAQACVGYDEGGLPSQVVDRNNPHPSNAPLKPFLSNPTSCTGDPVHTQIHLSQYEVDAPFNQFGDPDLSSPGWKSATADAPPVTGCNGLEFSPTLKARPTTNVADSPTGLEVDLHIPQNEDPDGLATAHLKKTVVTLPEGLVINAAGANGLDGCSPAQIGLTSPVGNDDPSFDKAEPSCPLSSTIGTVEVNTPVLDDPLQGSVYVANPHQNPFGSLLATYIVVHGPGVIAKLAGEVTPNPQTGRLSATFDDNPQVPLEDIDVDFFGGAAASLKTPATCGTYSTTSELTPWSAPDTGPPATPKDTYAIDQGPNGLPCGATEGTLPNSPSFQAGSTDPIAGAYSPFVLNLNRDDGTQRFSAINLSPPPGLIGKLAGTPPCSDAALAAAAARSGAEEKASPSCPAASEVGDVYAAAGAGPAPYNAPGKAYLAGPYKGAPLSMAFVTPATAGPFDLGTIVVRAAIHVDPKSTRISAVSDPIPTILEGIPLDVRSVSVRLDKPQFTLNPTSCDPSSVEGQLLSTTGSATSLSSRFQLAECGRLGFKPRLRLSLKGGTKRGKYPALTAVLRPRPGDANIAGLSVALPRSEFLAQNHIGTVCTRVQFAADQCPARSIYGYATAYTPLLDYPLTGPVYLRSSDNELPDLVPDLRGPAYQPLRIEAAGRTDSIRGGIRNSFDFVPDAPITKVVLKMQGAKKGLLQNSTDICAKENRAAVSFTAHNGKEYEARPLVRAKCPKAHKRKSSKKHKR